MLTVLVLGLCVGIVLGLTGAGGGILAVPALMFSQGWTVAQAAPIGLLAVTGAAMIGGQRRTRALDTTQPTASADRVSADP